MKEKQGGQRKNLMRYTVERSIQKKNVPNQLTNVHM